jgi:hypothetical protein
MERRTEWFVEPGEPPLAEVMPADGAGIPPAPASREDPATRARRRTGAPSEPPGDGVLEIDAADDDLDQIVRDLDR